MSNDFRIMPGIEHRPEEEGVNEPVQRTFENIQLAIQNLQITKLYDESGSIIFDCSTGDALLGAAPNLDLEAATKKYVDDAVAGLTANLAVASGDKLMWIGSSVPSGFTLDSTFDDRIPILETTIAQLGDTGGSWTISGLTASSPSITVNNHTLTLAQIPAHTHDTTVFNNNSIQAGDTGASVATSLLQTSSGSTNRTYTSDSKGSSNGHNHTASASAPTISSNGNWKGRWAKWGAIVKS